MWFKAGKWKITNINIVFVVCAFYSNHREFPNANDNGISARAHRHHISMYLHIIASMHAYHYHEPNEQRIKRWTFSFLFKSHFKKKETRQEKDTHNILSDESRTLAFKTALRTEPTQRVAHSNLVIRLKVKYEFDLFRHSAAFLRCFLGFHRTILQTAVSTP